MLGYLSFSKLSVHYNYDPLSSFCSGVAVYRGIIWVGHSIGLLGLILDSDNIRIDKFIPSSSAILDVCSNDSYLITCSKQLIVWNWDNALKELVKFEPPDRLAI